MRKKRIQSLWQTEWPWLVVGLVCIVGSICSYHMLQKERIRALNTLVYHRTTKSDPDLLQQAAAAVPRALTTDEASKNYLAKHPVFISMTTSPTRIGKIADIIACLDLEKVTAVLINIPKVFARTGATYQVPEALVNHPKVRIQEVEKDYGPATKLLPGIQTALQIDGQAIVITLDDDHAYPRSIINEHIYAIAHGAKVSNIIDARAGNLATGFFALPSSEPNLYAAWPSEDYSLIHGWSSVAYVAEIVPVERIITWLEQEQRQGADNHCFFSDDFLISYALALAKVPITSIKTSYAQCTDILPLSYGLSNDALHRQALKDGSSWQLDKMNDLTKYRLEKCFAFLVGKNS